MLRVLSALLALTCVCSATIDVTSFSNQAILRAGVYNIYWNVTNDAIILALQVSTTGWVGFAIGEQTSGSMPGADFVTGWVDDTTMEASIQDRYALDYVMPSLDTCQDWALVDSDQSEGITTLVVTRALATTDNQDRPIVAGPMKVLYAFGTSDTFGYHGPNSRSEAQVEFIPSPDYAQNSGSDGPVYTYELLMNNSKIPAVATTYFCQTFQLPDVDDGQIIQIDPIIQPNPTAVNLVHHFLAYSCYTNASNWNTNPSPQQCNAISSQCDNLFYIWAVGGGPLVLPKEAGFRIGKARSYSFKYLFIQVHYNNQNLLSGLTDNSGIRVHYTTAVTRPNDASILNIGDIGLTFPALPVGQQAIALESECPSECTSKFPHDIHVIGDALHMHQVGSQTWSTHWHNGSMVVENRVDFWDFALQVMKPVNYTIQRGDSMHLHCTYNTKSSSSPVNFGHASTDEMCLEYLVYYPIMVTPAGPFGVCGNYKLRGQQVSVCGSLNDAGVLLTPLLANPSEPDPPSSGQIYFGTPCGSSPTQAPTIAVSSTSGSTSGSTPTSSPITTSPSSSPPVTTSPSPSSSPLPTVTSPPSPSTITGSHANGASVVSVAYIMIFAVMFAVS